jgi:hypothetical protein
VSDVIFVAMVITFFAVAVAYIRGCERIVGSGDVVRVVDADDTEPGERQAA